MEKYYPEIVNVCKKALKFSQDDLDFKRIKENKDLLGRNYKYEVINIDQTFPDYIQKNREKYKEWIL